MRWSSSTLESFCQLLAQRNVTNHVAEKYGQQVPLFHPGRLHFVIPAKKHTKRWILVCRWREDDDVAEFPKKSFVTVQSQMERARSLVVESKQSVVAV